LITQLDSILAEFNTLQRKSKHDDLSDLPDNEVIRLITRSRASIERITGNNSAYSRQSEEIIKDGGYPGYVCSKIIGVVDSLRADISAGFMKSYIELIHGELFSDFLEMAKHLLSEGYKDPAAVIAGSALESHLRNLCDKNYIESTIEKDGKFINKKADTLNAELSKIDVYSKLDQKNITAWLDLRNKAAHGQYGEYSIEQVSLLIDGISNFITRNPA
jgi:hypothetical protein